MLFTVACMERDRRSCNRSKPCCQRDIHRVTSVARSAKLQPEVNHVVSVLSIVSRMERDLQGCNRKLAMLSAFIVSRMERDRRSSNRKLVMLTVFIVSRTESDRCNCNRKLAMLSAFIVWRCFECEGRRCNRKLAMLPALIVSRCFECDRRSCNRNASWSRWRRGSRWWHFEFDAFERRHHLSVPRRRLVTL